MRSRKNGEGSFAVVTIKGVKYQRYRYPNGKQVYAKTQKELREKMKVYESSPNEDKIEITTDFTLLDSIELWIKSMYGNLEPTTYDAYSDNLRRISTHRISNYQIESITPEMISTILSDMAQKYSLSTIQSMNHVIKASIKHALKKNIISDFDFNKIVIPKERDVVSKKREVPIVIPEDIERIYKEATAKKTIIGYKHPLSYRLLVFIMYSGLRVGEAMALTWDDVEPDYTFIHVRGTGGRIYKRDKKGVLLNEKLKTEKIIKRPKTDKSYRTIPLPERAKEILKELDEKEHTREDFVFPSIHNSMMEYTSIQGSLKKLIKEAGCVNQNYTVHSLRHTYGSILISKGVDIKIVSKLLGHKNVAFTYNVYIGVLKEDEIKAVSVFDQKD